MGLICVSAADPAKPWVKKGLFESAVLLAHAHQPAHTSPTPGDVGTGAGTDPPA